MGLVIGMGVLIVVGITILGYGLYRKANEPDFKFFKDEAAPVRSVPKAGEDKTGFGDLRLPVPPGTHIRSHGLHGARLLLHLEGDVESLVIIDVDSGRIEGRVLLEPTTP